MAEPQPKLMPNTRPDAITKPIIITEENLKEVPEPPTIPSPEEKTGQKEIHEVPTKPEQEEKKEHPKAIIVNTEETKELEAELKELKYAFLIELKAVKSGTKDLNSIKEIFGKLNQLRGSYKTEEERTLIDKYIEELKGKLYELSSIKSISESPDYKLLIMASTKGKMPLKVELDKIDVQGIVNLYNTLNQVIETKDLKQITAARGRLIKKLKKEQRNIDESYQSLVPLMEIKAALEKENVTIDDIKAILEKDENRNLLTYFESSLTDLQSFSERFQDALLDESIQKLVFLKEALVKELEKQKNVLTERYGTEFLEKKTTIPTLVTVLPKAVGLSVQKLSTTISELKEAKTKRRKMALITETMQDIARVVGTPVLYAGKFVASNWYTLYLGYKSVNQIKLEKEEMEKKAAEEKAAKEEAERKAAEEKAAAEKAAKEEAARKAAAEKAAKEKAAQEAAERKAAEEKAAKEAAEQKAAEEKAAKEAAEQKAAEEKAAQEAAEQKAAAEKAQDQEKAQEDQNEQAKEDTTPKEQPKPAEKEKPAESTTTPDPTLDSTYPDGVLGSTMTGALYSPAFNGNIVEQLESGYITPDTKITVWYMPAGVPAWHFWATQKGEFTLREMQEIWNWSPEIDFDNYEPVLNQYK